MVACVVLSVSDLEPVSVELDYAKSETHDAAPFFAGRTFAYFDARRKCALLLWSVPSQGLQHQLHVSRKPGAAACREPHIAYASPIDSDKAIKHIESKCCAVIGGCSFALLWLSAFLMGAATVAYSGKNPPLAILAAAQKAGLDVQVNEVKDGNKDAPPTLTMADGYVIWPMTSLTRRHQPPQRFGLGAE